MKDTAVVVYLDKDNDSLVEIFWLYRSWKYSGSYKRSDLIIFHHPSITTDMMPLDDGMMHIPLAPISETDKLWADYGRINSTWFLTTPDAEVVKNYEYTLRTDIDVFLTKHFVNFRPRLTTFGINVYATNDTNVGRKINAICEKYKIKQYHMNADCHIMTKSVYIQKYAQLQYDIAKRLKTEEFKDGPGQWPHWYEYVINMYSAGIAANKMFGMGFNLGGLAVMSMVQEPMGSTDYHVHAWHTEQNFSKLRWRTGHYDNVDLDQLDDEIIASYCLKMAGKRG